MKYSDHWDLSTIPQDALRSEWARRMSARRKTIGYNGGAGGRPSKPTPCERCGEMQPSRREADAHCREPRE